MTDTRTVKGNVTVEQDSKYRVAYDLAEKIAYHEEMDKKAPRKYWLELYSQCLRVANHGVPPDNFQERPSRS